MHCGAHDILGLTSTRFIELVRPVCPPEQSLDAYRRGYRDGVLDPPAAAAVRPIVRRLDEAGTVKFVQSMHDGREIESVLIPGRGSSGAERATLCVSSQVGCAMGCTFCQTARMGLQGNLTIADIVGQWFAARHVLDTIVRNIVFMGMGEPLDNVDAVIGAIEILADRNGPDIAPSRITVSTVGHAPGIERLARFVDQPGYGKLGLAVSVNAPDDEIRASIMPINRATNMSRLMEAMRRWPGRRVLIEYVVIPGVNDADDHARALCAYLEPLACVVNVIPYNPRRDSPWPAPDAADVDRFAAVIAGEGQPVRRRRTRGRRMMAACGQLGATPRG